MVDVPMALSITNAGITYMKTEARAGNKLRFSGFRLGDSLGLDINPDRTTIAGTLVYTGTPAQMNWTRVNDNEVTLRLVLPHDVGTFYIGSFVITAGDNDVPFFVGKLSYRHYKEHTQGNMAGGNFVIQVRFLMYDVHLHWTFANMVERYAAAEPVLTLNALPSHPVKNDHQLVKTDAVPYPHGRKGFFLYPGMYGLNWMANGLAFRNDDTAGWRINGGKDGDNHNYQWPRPA